MFLCPLLLYPLGVKRRNKTILCDSSHGRIGHPKPLCEKGLRNRNGNGLEPAILYPVVMGDAMFIASGIGENPENPEKPEKSTVSGDER